MIKSMTGYGRAQGSFSGGDITVEIKSVNNRYLDCGVKLPRGYAYLEEGVKSQVQKAISRGKVDVFITINAAGADNVKISVNEPVAKGYIDAMHRLVQEYGIQDDISASAISKFSDVFLVEKQEQDENEVKSAISGVVAEALGAFDAMRTREGEALKTDAAYVAGFEAISEEKCVAGPGVPLYDMVMKGMFIANFVRGAVCQALKAEYGISSDLISGALLS